MACALNGPEMWELRGEYSGLYGVSVEKINKVQKGRRRERKTEGQRARERIFSKITKHYFLSYFFQIGFFYYYYLFTLLYNIVLVLPYIDLNLPRVYMYSTS